MQQTVWQIYCYTLQGVKVPSCQGARCTRRWQCLTFGPSKTALKSQQPWRRATALATHTETSVCNTHLQLTSHSLSLAPLSPLPLNCFFRSRIRDVFVTVLRCISVATFLLPAPLWFHLATWSVHSAGVVFVSITFSVHLHPAPPSQRAKEAVSSLRFHFWDEVRHRLRLWFVFEFEFGLAVGSGCSIRLVFSALYDFCMFSLLRFSNTHTHTHTHVTVSYTNAHSSCTCNCFFVVVSACVSALVLSSCSCLGRAWHLTKLL